MDTTFAQENKLGPLENLGWTSLSVGIAAVLLPVIGLKALARTVFPRTAKTDVEEHHYLIN